MESIFKKTTLVQTCNLESVFRSISNQLYLQAYCIHYQGKLAVKRRYSEFLHVYEELMKIFNDFNFPKFPGKWPFQLSENQLEKRRIVLENFIQKSIKYLKQYYLVLVGTNAIFSYLLVIIFFTFQHDYTQRFRCFVFVLNLKLY